MSVYPLDSLLLSDVFNVPFNVSSRVKTLDLGEIKWDIKHLQDRTFYRNKITDLKTNEIPIKVTLLLP